MLFELAGPFFAELRFGPTPWHPHHIAERYGLLVIITLGEVILGTILAISAVVEVETWSLEAALVAFGGTALAFGMWWMYFAIPFGRRARAPPEARVRLWGYLQIRSCSARSSPSAPACTSPRTSSRGEAHVDATFAVLTIAIPVLVFETLLFALYALLVMQFDPFHVWLYLGVGGGARRRASSPSTLGASLGVGSCSSRARPRRRRRLRDRRVAPRAEMAVPSARPRDAPARHRADAANPVW